MANFTSFLDILPDPNNKIGAGGESLGSGEAGPGFASINFSSNTPVMRTRTNSGRMISRAIAGQRWTIDVTYNPLTREQFEPINSFLMARRGGLVPFFLELPQYRTPQNTTFATHVGSQAQNIRTNLDLGNLIVGNSYSILTAGNSTFSDFGASANTVGLTFTATDHGSGTGTVKALAGTTSILVDGFGDANDEVKVGDMFTIDSASDKKAYMVTRVETASALHSNLSPTDVAVTERVIHFTPGLQKALGDGVKLNFHLPKIRVLLASDVQSYSLNVNNLYQFSLKLEEAQI